MEEKTNKEEELLDDTELIDEELPGLYEHYRFVADKGQTLLRIDKFLTARIEHVSRNRIQMYTCKR